MDAILKKINISPVKRNKDNEITGPAIEEREREKEFLLCEVKAILRGEHHYARKDLPEKKIGKVVWIGYPGLTASIGPWMRKITKELDRLKGQFIRLEAWRYFVEVGEAKRNWYFGVLLEEKEYLCGGCTDYSGEGGHGKKLSETFLEILAIPSQTRDASYLIGKLVSEV